MLKPAQPQQKVMSATRTTGSLHIGHYFGWLSNCVKLQNDYECFFGVMDWHGMTSNYKTVENINHWNRDIFAEMLAWGVNPDKNTLFIQSQVPEHVELFMILSNLTPMGWLERVPTWKDSEEENKANDAHNLGRFAYPVLQAADIAIYFGALVPVGADQVAHLELTREIIRRFNHIYKGKIPEPKPLLTETSALPGLDGRKMSKSYNNSILLSEEESSLKKKLNTMPTDTKRVRREDMGDPNVCPVFTYHKLFSSSEDQAWVIEGCTTAKIGCGDCKARLHKNMNQWLSEPREKKKDLLNNPKLLDSIIQDGQAKAQRVARENLAQIKDWMKLS